MHFAAKEDEIDIVVPAIQSDLSFLEEWRAILEPYHLIIVEDARLAQPVEIPPGFHHDLYTPKDMERILGEDLASSLSFTGYACSSFGFLVSKKKYIYTLDEDCLPARDAEGKLIHVLHHHIANLKQPATPFYFNTLYDPYQEGSDFVGGYPFSLREGVRTAISHGLWLNVPDYDAPTQMVKPSERNHTLVDAVLTVPVSSLFPMSSINLAFDREVIGPTMFSGLVRSGGSLPFFSRYDTLDDIWCGLCSKVACDHLGYGVKTGFPYVRRNGCGNPMLSLQRQNKQFEWLEHIISFFQALRFPTTLLTAEDCYLEIAKQVKRKLKNVDPAFEAIGVTMEKWIEAWKLLNK